MGYNIADIFDKTVTISIRRRTLYENIVQEKYDTLSIKIISKVLVKEVDRTIEYYEELLKEINNDAEFEEIDFSIYDKMSFLINDFNKRIDTAEINNVKEYLTFSLVLKSLYILC